MKHHELWDTVFRPAISYVAAALGLGTAAGMVNITVGILSAVWLSTQLYRFWVYERPKLKAEAEALRRSLEQH